MRKSVREAVRLAASLSFVFTCLCTQPPAAAQVLYGSLVGTVTDPSGAVVQGAAITITNADTGLTRETSTNEAGQYSVPNLLPGSYEVKVTKPGFRAFSKTGVAITINTVTRVDVPLEVGAVTEAVTVEAEAATLQTDKADVHVELNVAALKNLTLPNYRNYQSLINLVPGATPAGFQNAVTDTPARALTTNINGTNRNNNNTRVDGATNVYIWLPHHTVYVPPVETIETVNITTNAFDAEQGMAGGAAITVNTKSGTNDFHGVAFAFWDGSSLRARNFFAVRKPRHATNIDGGTLGGPIVRNKLFFFGGWEGYRERAGRNAQQSVATPALRSGDFSGTGTVIYDPSTGDPDGRNRQPFAGGRIPLSRQSAIMRKLQDLVPLPNAPGDFANYLVAGTAQAMNRDNFDIKINWNRNEKNQIWGKYGLMDAQVTGRPSLGEAIGPCLCDGGLGVGNTVVNVATLGSTYTIRPNLLVDGVLGFTRMGQNVKGPDFGRNIGSEVLGIPGTNGPDPRQSGFPPFDISGYTSLGNTEGWSPIFRNDQSWTLNVNANWIRGKHDVRFGFDGVHHHLNHWQPELGAGPRGRFGFSGQSTALNGGPSPNRFNAYAQFLLGLPNSVGKSIQFLKMSALEYQLGWYIRDRWALTPKLTLNLGLRYEYYPLMTRGYGGIERYDQSTNLVYLGGLGNVPKNAGITTSKKLFAPRVGIAYRLNDATVVRTGYGITYNPMPLGRPLRGFYPLTIGSDFNTPGFGFTSTIEQGIPEICCPDISQGVVPLPAAALMRTPFLGLLKRGYIQSWNFVVQRKLPAEFVIDAGYVGTQTVRSFADLNINAGQVIGAGNAGRPAFATFGRFTDTLLWQGWVNANYHALQVAVNRQFSRGFMVKGAYTYSKAINWTDDDGWAGMPLTNYFPALRRNRAQAGYNIPQIFQLGYVYDLPVGKGKKWVNSGPAQWIVGGWQWNGIFSAYQGRPFTVGASGASLNLPGTAQTADQVLTDVKKLGGIGRGNPFYDTSAFRPVTEPRFGSTGRNILRGPGVVNLSASIFKSFPIREGWDLSFRAESFNLTNTPHFNNPSANVSDPASFMAITGAASDERLFRLGLRLSF